MGLKFYSTKYTGVFYRETNNKEKVFYIRYKAFGKSKTVKVGSKSEGITAAYASKMRAKYTSIERLKDESPLYTVAIPSLDEAAAKMFEAKSRQSDNKNNIGRYNNHIKAYLGKYRLDEITKEMITDFALKKKKIISKKTTRTLAPKTINDLLNLISSIFNYAIKEQNLKISNPASANYINREKIDNDRERYLTPEEIKILLQHIKDRKGKVEVTKKLLLFVKLSLSTGARVTSVLTITKSDVNIDNGTILIKNHKTNNTYTAFIHPSVKEMLRLRIASLKPTDYIINESPTPTTRMIISKSLQPILNLLFNQGLDINDRKRRVVLHTFRHTFASLLAIKGTPIFTIKNLMDHADINQTMRYAKLQPDAGASAVRSLDI